MPPLIRANGNQDADADIPWPRKKEEGSEAADPAHTTPSKGPVTNHREEQQIVF